MNNPEYSIILPLYNQAEHIDYIVDEYKKTLDKEGISYEVLLIINASKDDSYSKAIEMTGSLPAFRVFNLDKGGWGRAVRYGIEKAQGNLICYTNSARTNPADLAMILRYAGVNKDNVIKANRIVRDSFLRKLGSVIFNLEYRFLFRFPVWDVNGTPKVFPAKILKSMDIISKGDLIDAEVMAICARQKVMLIEIPIRVHTRISGKSTTGIMSAIKMYWGLLRLRRML